MPRISAPTVAENREQRRGALLTAAATLIQRDGGFTVAEVAREVGLSRSAVYEYYSSASELIADVLVDELQAWSAELAGAARDTPRASVHAWIEAVLRYVADGRHLLVRAAGSIELPETRRSEVQQLHRSLVAPLVDALAAAGCPDPSRYAAYVWGVVDAAISRIESSDADASEEIRTLTEFIDGALNAVRAGHLR